MNKFLTSTLLAAVVLAPCSASAEDYYAGLTFAKGGTLTSVSYTHLTLPTTPYV